MYDRITFDTHGVREEEIQIRGSNYSLQPKRRGQYLKMMIKGLKESEGVK